jgi:hypothetical protein
VKKAIVRTPKIMLFPSLLYRGEEIWPTFQDMFDAGLNAISTFRWR